MANDINIKWLKLWDSICTDPASFESELNKEIGGGQYSIWENSFFYRQTI